MVPLREHETLWQYLKKQTRPIVLYGMRLQLAVLIQLLP